MPASNYLTNFVYDFNLPGFMPDSVKVPDPDE